MTTRISENAEGDGDARKAAVEVLGTLQPAMLATHEAAVAALLEAILHDTAAYVRATAVQVFSQLDASQLTEEQAKAFEKHTMGKCFAKAQYNGKQAAICF
uniref:Uncharacterized protein n=1 Tax=Haptolina ericina TaxID=156174 RepID=A0A7S3EV62_9EUKA|mmetsp:Transcript_27022/g.61060  ORF Transcript_27022/g.61060 Transcript_27022/m.61060 type:complete len:101 (+) Transcript_27022:2-304(+)